jgi:hypothetical protein
VARNQGLITGFKAWLRKQKRRDDPVGDFAKDFLGDCKYCDVLDEPPGPFRSVSEIDQHLRDVHETSDAVLAARDLAWREYVAQLKGQR